MMTQELRDWMADMRSIGVSFAMSTSERNDDVLSSYYWVDQRLEHRIENAVAAYTEDGVPHCLGIRQVWFRFGPKWLLMREDIETMVAYAADDELAHIALVGQRERRAVVFADAVLIDRLAVLTLDSTLVATAEDYRVHIRPLCCG